MVGEPEITLEQWLEQRAAEEGRSVEEMVAARASYDQEPGRCLCEEDYCSGWAFMAPYDRAAGRVI